MPRGRKCPFCGELTLHDDALMECSNCGFIGWQVFSPVNPGPGKGYKCVNCGKSTLHSLKSVADKNVEILRCSVCMYAGVRPTTE